MRAFRIVTTLLFVLTSGCAGEGGSASESDASTGTETDTGTTATGETGSDTDDTPGLDPDGPVLTDFDAFQVVAIPLMDAGIDVPASERPAPIVAGRAVVLRAKVTVPPGWEEQDVELRVDVTRGDDASTYSTITTLAGSSDPSDASSGLMVELPAAVVEPGAHYVVSLWRVGEASPSDQFPAAGEASLSPEDTGPIKIHVVPFEVDGRTPDTSVATIEGFANAVYAYYPTSDVEVTVGTVQPNPYPDLPADEVLGDALFDVGVVMEQVDQAPADVYYYGLMQPAETREDYNGVTGSSQELDLRAGFAIGAGFGDALSESTLVHELGHLHFLKHAPCGSPDDVDPGFPHADGMAHTEGYDVRTQGFVDTDVGTDLMSYCQPRWVSAYHYKKMASWVQVSQTW